MYATLFNGINPNGTGEDISFDDLCLIAEYPPGAPSKLAQRGITLTKFKGDKRNSLNIEYCSGIALDIDGGHIPMDKGFEIFQNLGINAVFYSTASDAPGHPHWRALIPFTKPMAHGETIHYLNQCNHLLDGVVAPESAAKGQFFFFDKIAGQDYDSLASIGVNIDESLDFEYLIESRPIKGVAIPREDDDDWDFTKIDAGKHPVEPSEYPALLSALTYLAAKGFADHRPLLVDRVALKLRNSGEPGLILLKYFASLSVRHNPLWADTWWENERNPPQTGYKAIFATAKNEGWLNHGSNHNYGNYDQVKALFPGWEPPATIATPTGGFLALGTTFEEFEALEEKAKNAKTFGHGMFETGSVSMVVAPSEVGKTAFVLRAVVDDTKSGHLDGSKIIHINLDDGMLPFIEKGKYLLNHGIKSTNTMSSEMFNSMLESSITDGTADGVILIVDTTKKMFDVMNKTATVDALKRWRGFTNAGGTIIGIGHTNKEREGFNTAFSGTADLLQDVDRFYMFERLSQKTDEVQTIQINIEKGRGVALGIEGFRFKKPTLSNGLNWLGMFESLEVLTSDGEGLKAEVQDRPIDGLPVEWAPVFHRVMTIVNSSDTPVEISSVKNTLCEIEQVKFKTGYKKGNRILDRELATFLTDYSGKFPEGWVRRTQGKKHILMRRDVTSMFDDTEDID